MPGDGGKIVEEIRNDCSVTIVISGSGIMKYGLSDIKKVNNEFRYVQINYIKRDDYYGHPYIIVGNKKRVDADVILGKLETTFVDAEWKVRKYSACPFSKGGKKGDGKGWKGKPERWYPRKGKDFANKIDGQDTDVDQGKKNDSPKKKDPDGSKSGSDHEKNGDLPLRRSQKTRCRGDWEWSVAE